MGLPGAYVVTVIVSGRQTTFSLTNLAGAPNLALGKSATQSSTLPGYPFAAAGAAVDGNTNGNFYAGSVTATNADGNAWWQVDLSGIGHGQFRIANFNPHLIVAARG